MSAGSFDEADGQAGTIDLHRFTVDLAIQAVGPLQRQRLNQYDPEMLIDGLRQFPIVGSQLQTYTVVNVQAGRLTGVLDETYDFAHLSLALQLRSDLGIQYDADIGQGS